MITTTTIPLSPIPPQQSTTDPELASRFSALENKTIELEKQFKLQDKTIKAQGSRIFVLELRDLPHKIGETVCEYVKESVQIALQAPLRDRFRDLSEDGMKWILHQRMFKR